MELRAEASCLDWAMMSNNSPYAAALSAIPVRRQEILIDGTRTAYWEYGPQDAEVTILLTHGYRGDHHGFEPVIAQLPEVRFISPDLPGFGESAPFAVKPHSIEGYAAWLGAFGRALGLESQAILLGHSFGSIVASRAVADGYSPLALILVNPISVSGLEGPRRWATRATVGFYRLGGILPEKLGNAFLGSWAIVQGMSMALTKTRDRALRRWIHAEHHRYFSAYANRRVVVEGFDASVSHHVGEFASQITVPTLLIAAEKDDITPVSAHQPVADLMADASLVVLPGVGHLVHYETPHLAASAMRAFIAERGGPRR